MQFEPRPIKRLGQNWLRDPQTIHKMVAAAELRPTDLVIEVGPGTGAITKPLANEAGEVIAYEVDHELVTQLKEELHWAKNVQIIAQNVLTKDFDLPKRTYKVVGSLPYYITSPILEKLLLADPIASLIVLMIQREVADKIISTVPNSSFLGSFVRIFGEPEIIAQVQAGAFFPRPNVESTILRIRTHPEPLVEKSDLDQFISLLHAGFTEPRKQLHNSLSAGLTVDTAMAKNFLQTAGIDSERRAETLELTEWINLYQVIKKA